MTGACQATASTSPSWKAPQCTAPSPKNATADAPSPAHAAPPAPDGDRNAGADDSVGAENPEIGLGDVHRSAASATGPRLAAEQLGHHRLRIGSLGKAVAVAAVRGGDQVRPAQRRARAGGDRLLADRRVNEAVDVAVAKVLADAQLERADATHLGKAGEQDGRLGVGGRRLVLGGRRGRHERRYYTDQSA